jgi:hypothetical protein
MTDTACTLDTRIVRNPDLVTAPMDGDIVMLSISKGNYYGINPVGVQVWEWLDRPKSLRELAQSMVQVYEVDQTTAESDLQRFVARLLQEDIVQVA